MKCCLGTEKMAEGALLTDLPPVDDFVKLLADAVEDWSILMFFVEDKSRVKIQHPLGVCFGMKVFTSIVIRNFKIALLLLLHTLGSLCVSAAHLCRCTNPRKVHAIFGQIQPRKNIGFQPNSFSFVLNGFIKMYVDFFPAENYRHTAKV